MGEDRCMLAKTGVCVCRQVYVGEDRCTWVKTGVCG